jgi:hypothetical protein
MTEKTLESVDSKTDLEGFLSELGGGVFREKLALILSQVALATSVHGNNGKKGKVNVSFTITRVNDNDQVMITHKLEHVTPTNRGDKSARDLMSTPMFVGRGGKLTIDQPRESCSGQKGFRLGE